MHPPIRIRILASGSHGNTAIVSFRPRHGAPTHVIIDLGLSPRKLCAALADENICTNDVCAVLLTHADSDHLHGGWARRWPFERARVLARTSHHPALQRGGIQSKYLTNAEEQFPEFCAQMKPIALPHDANGSTGFRISFDGATLGWATDLGRMTHDALGFFCGVQALCIESNYDPQMQQQSTRPQFLKDRITGGRGHLSNHETLSAVLHIHEQCPLRHIVLLHLSSQCNTPTLVRDLWNAQVPNLSRDMSIAKQNSPLPWLSVGEPRICHESDSTFTDTLANSI